MTEKTDAWKGMPGQRREEGSGLAHWKASSKGKLTKSRQDPMVASVPPPELHQMGK
jgi:hypothetical protein